MQMPRRRTAVMVATVVVMAGAVSATTGTARATTSRCAAAASSHTIGAAAAPHTTGKATGAGSHATTGKVTVWLAGDSTVQNGTGTCPIGWGREFGAYFTSDVTVANYAVAGRSIQTWLYDPNVTTTQNSAGECVISPQTYSTRWQAMLDPNSGMKAGDYLLIQFGINDGAATCNRHVGSARYQQLLAMMAEAAKARGAHPVFLTPVAAITCKGSTAVGNRGFVTETVAAGTAANVPVIDLHKLSTALYNKLGLCPDNNNYTSGPAGAFFCDDHTHFEAAGARQIAGVIATALRDQRIDLSSYLR